jgi:hypothetical protein
MYGLMALALSCAALADDASVHEHVAATYNFLPRDLSQQQIAAKSNELDAFWTLIREQGQAGLSALRVELERPDAPVFFRYDGAKLLLSLSTARPDKKIALDSIARADLRDLQRNDYFLTVHSFAVDGFDTTDAALKILGDDKFVAYIPQHALTLNQDLCLAFLLLPTNESFYLDRAIDHLFVEKSVVAQKSLLSVIADTVTKKGDAAIERFWEDATQPKESRDYAKLILDSYASMGSVPILGWSFKGYDDLKQKQRVLFDRVSDEALSEWERLRLKLRHAGPH